jgi:hypothetical protein
MKRGDELLFVVDLFALTSCVKVSKRMTIEGLSAT